MTAVDSFPDEILLKVIQYLPAQDLARAGRVCRRFRRIAAEDSLWKPFCQRDFLGPAQAVGDSFKATYQRCHTNVWKRVAKVDLPFERASAHFLDFYKDQILYNQGNRISVLQQPDRTFQLGTSPFPYSALIRFDDLFVTGSSDPANSDIRLWDFKGKWQRSLVGHKERVLSLIEADSRLISGSQDETIRLWDLETAAATCFDAQAPVTKLHFSKNVLMSSSGSSLVCPCDVKIIKLWDLRTKEPIAFLGHQEPVVSFDCFEDKIICGSSDNRISIWDRRKLQVLSHVSFPSGMTALAPSGNCVISAFEKGDIFIWNLETRLSKTSGHPYNGRWKEMKREGDQLIASGEKDGIKHVALFQIQKAKGGGCTLL